MNIIVCIKQVPDTTEVKIDYQTNTLIREGVPSIINPFDKNAVEEALLLREKHGGKITVISMGPPQVQEALRETLAMGADEAILISDRALAGSDTLATSYVLSQAIKKIGHYDLILCGKQAIDGDTAQVGPGLAEKLNLPQIVYVRKIEIKDGRAQVERVLEDGFEIIKVNLPVLFTVVKEINEPRHPSLKGVLRAQKSQIVVWSAVDIAADPSHIGLVGSPTQVIRIFTPPPRGESQMLTGTPEEITNLLVGKLRWQKII